MSVGRVALVYDDRPRPETTGTYCLRALGGLTDVRHFLPHQLQDVRPGDFDLFINVDDGFAYDLPPTLRPSVWWAIDTHVDLERCLQKAHNFDLALAAQRQGVFELRDAGISTEWLPLACDPDVHRPHAVEKRLDVSFVGNVCGGARAELLEILRRRFPNNFFGQCYFDEMARVYSASRVVFNRSVRNDLNMRVFEALGCGAMLLTDDLGRNEQAEFFHDGKHLATYRCAEELVDKLVYYLARGSSRDQIAAAGRAEVLAKHTYRHRMHSLLAAAERLQRESVTGTWPFVSADKEKVSQSIGVDAAGFTAAAKVKTPSPVQLRELEHLAPDGNSSYYEFARPEILERIPRSAQRVLEIGCGAGRLGESLKARQDAEVLGVELSEFAAAQARSRLDAVFVGDIEQIDLPVGPRSLDTIVCGDVLEHLRDPGALLRRARDWLGPGGALIASIPNVRHHSVVRALLDGNWTYESAGLLDSTHLRFFTRRDIEEMFRLAGYNVERIEIIPGPGYGEWVQTGRPTELRVGRLHIPNMDPAEVEEFFVYQFLVTAVPAGCPQPARAQLTSREKPRLLRLLYLGDFSTAWRHEAQAAIALEDLGHTVARLHEHLMPSVDHVRSVIEQGRYDCLLFYKGRIGARSAEDRLRPTGETIESLLRDLPIPAYTWYVDRAFHFDFDPSRERWMRRVAPLCRVAFVADGPLTAEPWARWHLLREPITPTFVQRLFVEESERRDIAFIGQLYGPREKELQDVEREFAVTFINGVYGSDLSAEIPSYRVILGPRYPCVPGYWGNRIYVVLGHGGFFLAPEVAGMREDGFIPGVHFALLGEEAAEDVRYWLPRAAQRARIARAGQDFVLRSHTYRRAAEELCRVILDTMD